MTHETFSDGYQAALADIADKMSEESTEANALGAALAWILANGNSDLRVRTLTLVQRFCVDEDFE